MESGKTPAYERESEGGFVKDYLKARLYGKENFNKKMILLITYRSKCVGSVYLNEDNVVQFYLVDQNYKNKDEVAVALLVWVVKKAKERNNGDAIRIEKDSSNVLENIVEIIEKIQKN